MWTTLLFPELDNAVAVGVGARNVGHHELVAVQMEADIAREGHTGSATFGSGLVFMPKNAMKFPRRHALLHVLLRDDQSAPLPRFSLPPT